MHRAMLVQKPLPDAWFERFSSWVRDPASSVADLAARLAAIGLSARETEVFVELATGATAEVAGIRLGIAQATVYAHRSRVHKRLGASNLAEVIALAYGWR